MYTARQLIATVLITTLASCAFAQSAHTTAAFDHYIAGSEGRILQQRSSAASFLSVDQLPTSQRSETISRLHRGEIVIQNRAELPEIPDGLIHDWTGTVFIPNATVAQVLDLVRDYDHLTRYYSPDVMQSHLISHHDDDFHIFMRLHKKKIVTVILDTEYEVHYAALDPAHQYSLSRSTRVSEIADPGTPNEHPVPAGHDHGFMWRLNSYWAFEQVGDGVLLECEAISLTRDVPTGLGWLIGPFIQSIPRESLRFTLNATRAALNPPSAGTRP